MGIWSMIFTAIIVLNTIGAKRCRCHLGLAVDVKPLAGGGFHHLPLYREKDVKRKHL